MRDISCGKLVACLRGFKSPNENREGGGGGREGKGQSGLGKGRQKEPPVSQPFPATESVKNSPQGGRRVFEEKAYQNHSNGRGHCKKRKTDGLLLPLKLSAAICPRHSLTRLAEIIAKRILHWGQKRRLRFSRSPYLLPFILEQF